MGVDTPSSVSAFNPKEHQCHVYSDSMPLKQILGQTTEPQAGFKVNGTQPRMEPCYCEHGAACGVHCISYVHPCMPSNRVLTFGEV